MSILLDPTAERSAGSRARQPRPSSFDGLKVGLLDISKSRGNIFLDRLDENLSGRGIEVIRYMKPTHTRTAPVELQQKIAEEVDLVVEGLAD